MPRDARLTQRELQILLLMAGGLTDRQIAVQLGIGRRTVSNHVSVILLKIDARGRAHAVSKGHLLGLLSAVPRESSIRMNPS